MVLFFVFLTDYFTDYFTKAQVTFHIIRLGFATKL